MSKPTQVLPFLFLGGKTEAKSKDVLQKLKIKYILNCTPSRNMDPEAGCPCFFEKEQLFKYLRIPIFDNRGEDILGHMESALRFIEEGKHYGGVLVHCLRGVSRSASFVIGYLMKYNEMTVPEALSYLQVYFLLLFYHFLFAISRILCFVPSKSFLSLFLVEIRRASGQSSHQMKRFLNSCSLLGCLLQRRGCRRRRGRRHSSLR
jgi:hypothetical protein